MLDDVNILFRLPMQLPTSAPTYLIENALVLLYIIVILRDVVQFAILRTDVTLAETN